MDKPSAKPNVWGIVAIVAGLLAILAVALWSVAHAFISISGPPIPTTGYIAMTLGIVFSVVIGCGLMALLFYSNRHGYDECNWPDDESG